MWRHKQKEKELKMSRIRRIHDKEIKALERKCQIKNDKLRVDLMGGKFKIVLTSMHKVCLENIKAAGIFFSKILWPLKNTFLQILQTVL